MMKYDVHHPTVVTGAGGAAAPKVLHGIDWVMVEGIIDLELRIGTWVIQLLELS